MIRFKPLPILTIFTIPLVIILFMLGNWQWHRYQYKINLSKIAEPPPIDITTALQDPNLQDPKEFTKVIIEGKANSPLIAVKATEFAMYGNRYFGIINIQGKSLVYEYGFVGDKETPPQKDQSENIDTIAVIRYSKKPNSYIPDNKPPNDFYWPEVSAISQTLGQKVDNDKIYLTPIQMSPFGMAPRTNPYADEKGATYVEPARHLGYAMTWWGLLISLIIFYVALHIKQGRFVLK